MTLSRELDALIAEKHLLDHPYYQAWVKGELPLESLQTYSRQYHHHVDAFPRYVSQTHANCDSTAGRQFLLENLIEEERGEENHPQLWRDFAAGLGQTPEAVASEQAFPETQALVDTFFRLSRQSYAAGLAALYTYEQQVPEVARTKIDGLEQNYGIEDAQTLKFFEVHLEADAVHRQVGADLLDALSPAEQDEARAAAAAARDALWGFLDGVTSRTLEGAC